MTAPLRLWVTRTQPHADETAAQLLALGHVPIVAPVLVVRPLTPVLDFIDVAAIAFTSRNAVAAYAAMTPRRDLPVFTTGQATADAARAAGFSEVRSADGDVSTLSALIQQARPGLILHPTALEPAGALTGAPVRTVPVYETIEDPDAAAPDAIDGVLIHSPRAGRAAARLLAGKETSTLRVYGISAAAIAPFADSNFCSVAAAPYPNETALLKLIGALPSKLGICT